MLKVKSINNTAFYSNKVAKKQDNNEYRDPLLEWPLRGAAFTNEVGEALRPIIGGYATLSWAPALLYIGADVYDKYKNDQTDYSPDSRRCLKQACFQGLASVILPIFAVKGGQNLFSLFGLSGKEKITLSAQEQINRLAQQFVANGKLRAYRDNDAYNKLYDEGRKWDNDKTSPGVYIIAAIVLLIITFIIFLFNSSLYGI